MNVKPESRWFWLVGRREAKPESVLLWFVGTLLRRLMFAKPESRLIFSVVRVVAFGLPSGAGLCTSEQTDPQCGACTANLPALRFCGSSPVTLRLEVLSEVLLIANPESVRLWLVGPLLRRLMFAKPESVRLWFVGPLLRRLMFAKPESRLIFSVVRVVALSVPSGAGLCTSEQADPQCGACTANLPALRFCGNSPVTLRREVLSEVPLIANPESRWFWLVGPLLRMLMFAKPESRLIFSVVRVVAFGLPSGAGLCTSEQTDPQCVACTANLPALRFCGSSPLLVGVRAEFVRR